MMCPGSPPPPSIKSKTDFLNKFWAKVKDLANTGAPKSAQVIADWGHYISNSFTLSWRSFPK